MRHMTVRTTFLGCVATLIYLTACSGHAPGAGPSSDGAQASEVADERDPCSLLDAKEVEAALGAPLATPAYRSNGGSPTSGGEECTYEDAHFHRIVVSVEWEGATMTWKLMGNLQAMVNQGPTKGMLRLADGSDLAGAWDEARVQGCCEFNTLLGDQTVSINTAGSNANIAAAAKLADAALKRLEKPLAFDGEKGVEAANAYEAAHRPKPRDACSIMNRAEVEAIVGPLSASPKAQHDSCDYQAQAPSDVPPQVYHLAIRWTHGYDEFHENNDMMARFAKGITAGIVGQGKDDIEKTLAGADGAAGVQPWEAVHANITGIAAVKNDVMMSIDTRGVSAGNAARLLQTAMSKL